jgi:hypothetical protein
MSLTSAMIEAVVGTAALDILSGTDLGFGFLSDSPSTVYVNDRPIPDNEVLKSLCGDIRISASRGVEKITKLPFEAGDIWWHHFILVGRASKVIAESTTADVAIFWIGSHDLRADILGCSYGGDEGTACWESWKKCACILAVIGLASGSASHAIVTTREED